MAMHDRYIEHYQPARFVKRYYGNDTIALNDIGIIAFYTPARIIDVYGLGNMEPLLLAKDKAGYTAEDLYQWAQKEHASIAILQTGWPEIRNRIPPQWIHVATWTIPRNVVFPDNTVGFFATRPEHETALRTRLEEFSKELPEDIDVEFH